VEKAPRRRCCGREAVASASNGNCGMFGLGRGFVSSLARGSSENESGVNEAVREMAGLSSNFPDLGEQEEGRSGGRVNTSAGRRRVATNLQRATRTTKRAKLKEAARITPSEQRVSTIHRENLREISMNLPGLCHQTFLSPSFTSRVICTT